MSVPAIKIILLVKRKPGLTLAEFQAYYETNHAPMFKKLGVLQYMSKYTRNYVLETETLERGFHAKNAPTFDVVTEACFDTEEDFAKFNAIMDPAVMKTVIADEDAFLDQNSFQLFLVREVPSIRR